MQLVAVFTDDQIAVLGSAIVFGGCLMMMIISQKIGDSVRGRHRNTPPQVVPFRTETPSRAEERKAA